MPAIGLLQLDCSSSEPVDARIVRTLRWIDDVASDCDMLVLPELWHVGAFDIEQARRHAEPLDGPIVTALRESARRHGTWVHGGSFCELTPEGDHVNTSVVLAPDGQVAATYRKIHLFGFAGGETALMSAGSEVVCAQTPLGTTGLATCYDLRFPEMFRRLVDAGATATVITSGWPVARLAHWDTLARARAIENQMLVVACNEVGQQPGVTLGGHSIVVDATGAVLAQAGAGEEFLRVEVDTEVTHAWREEFPALGDRRL